MKKIKKLILCFLCLDIILLLLVLNLSSSDKDKAASNTVKTVVEEEGDTEKKIALTFDDGPDREYTKQILDGLKERNIVATFFLIGKNIEGNEDLVKRMAQEGHLIGNHTYSHVRLTNMSNKEALIEINKTNRLIYSITGVPVKYIRPPFGAWNSEFSNETDLKVVMWDIDPRDWCTFDTECIVNHIVKNAKDDYIILMHDEYQTSVEAALQMVDQLKAQGYEFVTIDKLTQDNLNN